MCKLTKKKRKAWCWYGWGWGLMALRSKPAIQISDDKYLNRIYLNQKHTKTTENIDDKTKHYPWIMDWVENGRVTFPPKGDLLIWYFGAALITAKLENVSKKSISLHHVLLMSKLFFEKEKNRGEKCLTNWLYITNK